MIIKTQMVTVVKDFVTKIEIIIVDKDNNRWSGQIYCPFEDAQNFVDYLNAYQSVGDKLEKNRQLELHTGFKVGQIYFYNGEKVKITEIVNADLEWPEIRVERISTEAEHRESIHE